MISGSCWKFVWKHISRHLMGRFGCLIGQSISGKIAEIYMSWSEESFFFGEKKSSEESYIFGEKMISNTTPRKLGTVDLNRTIC